MSNIFIIIPSFNECEYIENVIKKVKKYTNNIIVIDDGSTDNTYKIASHSIKYALKHEINLGKGAALKTGCEFAFNKLGADAVVFIDGDNQHDPKHIPDFIRALDNKNEIVFGIRKFSSKMPIYKMAGNRLASFVVLVLFGKYIKDIPSGYKALSHNAYKKVKWDSSNYGVELEIAVKTAKLRLPFSVVTIDTIYHDYDRGMTIMDVLKMIIKIFEWRIGL